ncbi:MAG: hypothetical protein KIS87_01505 [Phycisphaeraceae bacterium]|nr:hypothetical protein [Phycisphaeraceae bacterium]
MNARPINAVAPCCSFAGFAVAIVAGASAGGDAGSVVGRALVAMFVMYAVGCVLAAVAARVVAEHADTYQRTNADPNGSGRVSPRAEAETA